jgi:DNA repair protein RecO (recombination protein O)
MNQIVTTGIVLNRLNFGEADRIITVITPDHGKLRLMAKGVRRVKSKLAGGIELFSVSAITYIPGKRDISTLVSTRLVSHYSDIVANITRTMLGYDFLKLIDKSTQDECEEEFYELLLHALQGLGDKNIEPEIVEAWFRIRLLKLLGQEPNLVTDANGAKLEAEQTYIFDFDSMSFAANNSGKYDQNHIKLLRLLESQSLEKIMQIKGIGKLAPSLKALTKTMLSQFVN